MDLQQQPLGSGFDSYTTIDEVLDGIDLTGRTALVTGGYSGLGWELTRGFTGAGASVVVPARRPEVARHALSSLLGVEIVSMDLADVGQVRRVAADLVAGGYRFDIVVANAGVMACPFGLVGSGWETQFAINHLGHFALVNALWPAIEPAAGRVVSVSSSGHQLSGIRWGDLHFTAGYDPWLAYGQSKTANILFARHLDHLAAGRGVRAFSLHPGGILTPLQRHMTKQQMVDNGWIDEDGRQIAGFLRSPAQGAATAAWAATSPQLDGLGGQYLLNCDVSPVAERIDMEVGRVMLRAVDPAEAARLWEQSADLIGIDAFN
jgi:NAD(P)-dependent dehydrogenase (short-subunit alcohol dehydrogenase family)